MSTSCTAETCTPSPHCYPRKAQVLQALAHFRELETLHPLTEGTPEEMQIHKQFLKAVSARMEVPMEDLGGSGYCRVLCSPQGTLQTCIFLWGGQGATPSCAYH